MPLIDAYIKCDDIKGGYNPADNSGKDGSSKTDHAIQHAGWSEIYSFDYTLSDEYPKINITKPIDIASSALYLLYLQNRSLELQKGKGNDDKIIQNLEINLCRWVDTDADGIVDRFIVFLKYTFKQCRVLDYDTSIDFDADDLPEEAVTFGFRQMTMEYQRVNSNVTPPKMETVKFGWDFTAVQTAK